MNRKVLLGIIILAAVIFLIQRKPTTHSKVEKEDFASTQSTKSNTAEIEKSVQNKVTQQSESTIITRGPTQIDTSKSGKYAIKIARSASAVQDETVKRDEFLRENRTSLVMAAGDENLVMMKLRAAKDRIASPHDRSLGHEFYPIEAEVAQKAIVSEDSYPVVYKESNGKMGLLTGVILVQSVEEKAAENLARSYPMDLQIYDPSIQLASFKVHNGEGLYDIYNRIKQNERVGSITVEVLDSYKGY